MFFSPFSIALTSLGEKRANLSAFRTFVRFVLVWIRRFPLPLGVWEGLRFVIVALTSYLFLNLVCYHKGVDHRSYLTEQYDNVHKKLLFIIVESKGSRMQRPVGLERNCSHTALR